MTKTMRKTRQARRMHQAESATRGRCQLSGRHEGTPNAGSPPQSTTRAPRAPNPPDRSITA